MTITELQAQAQDNLTRRSVAVKAANARLQVGDTDGYNALRYRLPPAYAEAFGVRVCVVVPQNRTVYRRAHTRFLYYVNDEPTTEAYAQSVLEKQETPT